MRVLLSALCLLGALIAVSPASSSECPRSDALASRDAKTGYRLRGDRCEGIYATPVSTTSRPRLVGFHRLQFPGVAFASSNTASINILASRPADRLSVRAVSLRPRTYYAMDTDLPQGRNRYAWETAILSSSQLSMQANELGVLACDNSCLPQPTTRYFPIELLAPAARAPDSGYVLIFQSEVGIEQATVTLLDRAGATVMQRMLSNRYVGSWPITTTIGRPGPGSYRVRFTGEATDGTRVTGIYSIVIP
jgi:hypothetical protein